MGSWGHGVMGSVWCIYISHTHTLVIRLETVVIPMETKTQFSWFSMVAGVPKDTVLAKHTHTQQLLETMAPQVRLLGTMAPQVRLLGTMSPQRRKGCIRL